MKVLVVLVELTFLAFAIAITALQSRNRMASVKVLVLFEKLQALLKYWNLEAEVGVEFEIGVVDGVEVEVEIGVEIEIVDGVEVEAEVEVEIEIGVEVEIGVEIGFAIGVDVEIGEIVDVVGVAFEVGVAIEFEIGVDGEIENVGFFVAGVPPFWSYLKIKIN